MTSRRTFLHLLAGGVGAGLATACSDAAAPLLEPPPPPPLDVRNFGARGDGVADDTGAIQRAIDALPPTGGTVVVPDGSYLVNGLTGIQLRSRMTFELAEGAHLRAIVNGLVGYALVSAVDADDVTIRGGWIHGDRDDHQGSATAQFGGIDVRGCWNALVEDVRVTDCWTDGILIAPSQARGPSRNVTLRRCVCDRNRRQGVSVVGCIGGVIEDCVFSNTSGNGPMAGLDVESTRRDQVRDLTIRRCLATGNAGGGIMVVSTGVGGIRVLDNECVGNAADGIAVVRSSGNLVQGNLCADNGRRGIWVFTEFPFMPARDNRVVRNVCERNAMVGIALDAIGAGSDVSRNHVLENVSRGNGGAGIHLTRAHEITIAENECVGNALAGVLLAESPRAEVVANRAHENAVGIQVAGGEGSALVGNVCVRNRRHGLQLERSVENLVERNGCSLNSQEAHLAFDNIFLDRGASGNVLRQNVCSAGVLGERPRVRYGLCINSSDCEANLLVGNQLVDGGSVAAFLDRGTSTNVTVT